MKQLTDHIELTRSIFSVTRDSFEKLALEVFRFQYGYNELYRKYCDNIRVTPDAVSITQQIPFLPIQFFKSVPVKSTVFEPQAVFESSGTTGTDTSKHFIKDTALYEESFLKAFEFFYGDVKDYCILGLLPSYLERNNSSLVFMVNELIRKSGHPQSGFFLREYEKLSDILQANEAKGQRSLLIGVTYALLDFFEAYPRKLDHTIVMETGGMKGRKEELTRTEVHNRIKIPTGIQDIHSEYGMTELLSQAYSRSNGIFYCPPWMKIVLRQEDDPFEIIIPEKSKSKTRSGVINVIDLANIYSCSFIATDDMGRLYPDGGFEVLGRLDNSDIRGCSLLLV